MKRIDRRSVLYAGAVAAAFVLALGTACPGDAVAGSRFNDTVTKSVPRAAAGAIVVQNSSGLVTVRGERGRSDITLEIYKEVREQDRAEAQRLFALMDVTVTRNGNEIVFAVKYPERSERRKRFLGFLASYSSGVRIDVSLAVPEDLVVRAETASGDAFISGLTKAAEATTSSGDIEITNVAGSIKAATASGDLTLAGIGGASVLSTSSGDIEADRVGGNLECKTSSGDITLTDIRGALEAASASGEISVEDAGSVFCQTVSGGMQLMEIRGAVVATSSSGDVIASVAPAASGDYKIRTSSGDIDLVFTRLLPGGFSLKAETTSGEIEATLAIKLSEVGRHKLSGVVREGKALVMLETASGDITITESEE